MVDATEPDCCINAEIKCGNFYLEGLGIHTYTVDCNEIGQAKVTHLVCQRFEGRYIRKSYPEGSDAAAHVAI